MDLRLLTYRDGDALRAGIDVDGVVVDAVQAAGGLGGTSEGWSQTVLGIIAQDEATLSALAKGAADAAGSGRSIDELTLAPPIPEPQKIICIGLNYHAHVEEAKNIAGAPNEASAVPILFTKFVTSLVGHEADVLTPPGSEKLDWEAELAVVIGRRASRVSQADALDYVAGYSAFNDVSARDLQLATPQWTAGKAADTLGPFGPVLVTKDEIPDPQALRVQARLNGKTMQDSTTDLMIFSVPRLIEFISEIITLVPGDVIATGTPSGIGIGRKPPIFMQPGDVIEVEVQDVGVLRNTIASAARD
jgi:2-keto-4-pentenoate hydratase/2-oxohepta-3-ene-1,7-dioic acid hydratase in catechol pathway